MKASGRQSTSDTEPGPFRRLSNFFDDRTGFRSLMHEALYERVPGGARWRYVWGSALVFAFMTQLVTGLFLWASYSASAQTAWESVYYIQYEMTGGWLLRGIHHFMAQAMVVLLALHLLQVVIDGAYRAPREVNFWLGLILMLLVLGMALTGYLLPWDQKGYWATIVATNLAGIVPGLGPSIQQLVIGGSEYGHHTLTRFFAIHAGFLPGTLILLLVVHLSLFRKHGLHAKQPFRKPDAMFWPDQVLKDAVAMLAVMAIILGVILIPAVKVMLAGGEAGEVHLGAELGAPADPSRPYAAARPEWYFLFLFQFLKVFEGWGASGEFFGAIVVPGLIMGVMFLMPIIGRWELGHRFNIAFTLAILSGAGLLTAMALNEDYYALWVDTSSLAKAEEFYDQTGGDKEKLIKAVDGDEKKAASILAQWVTLQKVRHSRSFLEAVSQAKHHAERAIELASRPEKIPPTGMLELIRNDAKTQGPILFAQYCASCHAHVDPRDRLAHSDISHSSAANLYKFGTSLWLEGLFDPNQVAGPSYFGNTAHKDGDMVSYVTDDMTDSETWTPVQINAVIQALAAEAERVGDGIDLKVVQEGRKLIADSDRCGGCHKFGDNDMDFGGAPDLTGWGTREWIVGIINDPSHERFYGEMNDRMPSFGKSENGATSMLATKEVELLADWLRESWYRPKSL